MISEKCTECSKQFLENTISYNKRTKDIFNPGPAICYDCVRIQRALNPSDKDIKKEILRLANKEHKQKIKNFVLLSNSNKNVQADRDELILKQRKHNRSNSSKTRAKRKRAYVEISYIEKKKIKDFYDNCPPGCHVDHVIPISKGGKQCIQNLQYLTAEENCKKHNKIKIEDLQRRFQKGEVSICFLQRKFRLSYESAQNVLKELELSTT